MTIFILYRVPIKNPIYKFSTQPQKTIKNMSLSSYMYLSLIKQYLKFQFIYSSLSSFELLTNSNKIDL